MLSFEVDEELEEHVAEVLRDGSYPNVGEYVRDLIRRDRDDRDFDGRHLKELREAFAAASDDCVYVTAQEVIARGQARRRA